MDIIRELSRIVVAINHPNPPKWSFLDFSEDDNIFMGNILSFYTCSKNLGNNVEMIDILLSSNYKFRIIKEPWLSNFQVNFSLPLNSKDAPICKSKRH